MLPRVILHNAVSADGRIDGFTPDLELYYGLVGTWKEDATLSGSETILKAPWEPEEEDESAFQPHEVNPEDPRPLLAIPDSRGRVRNWQQIRKAPYWRDAVALCSRSTPREYLDYLEKRHVAAIVAGEDRVDLRVALEELGARYGVKVVRADSGGVLNGALLRAGLVDEVSLMICPALVGGTSPRSMFVAPDLLSPESALPLRLIHLERLRDDTLWLRYQVIR